MLDLTDEVNMLKRIVCSLIVIFVIPILVSCQTDKNKLEILSNEIIRKMIESDTIDISEYQGVRFQTRHDKEYLDEISDALNNITNYKFQTVNESETQIEYTFLLNSLNKEIQFKIIWEKQPYKWLIADIVFTESDEILSQIPTYISERVLLLCSYLKSNNLDKIFDYTSKSFGASLDLHINSSSALKKYIETEMAFIQPRYGDYKIIFWSKEDDTSNDIVTVAFNEEKKGEFHVNFILNKELELIGLYCVEFEEAKDSILASLPTQDASYYYNSEGLLEAYEKKHHGNIESSKALAHESINQFGSSNYKRLYSMMSREYQSKMNFDEFTTYLDLMKRRCSISQIVIYHGSIFEVEVDYDVQNYLLYGNGKYMMSDSEEYGFTSFIEVKEDVVVTDDRSLIKDDILSFFVCPSKKYNVEFNDSGVYNTEPVLEGKSIYQSDDENYSDRVEALNNLIQALKYQDYDALWEIEKNSLGFKTKEESISFINLQEKIIGSFDSIYAMNNGYSYHMTGQFNIEVAFITRDQELGKLIVTFDDNNKIVSYNVAAIYRGELNEIF